MNGHLFRPFRPWRERSFQKGNLKYIILDLISEKPRYGYEIIRALENLSQGMYSPSAGAVYPTLQMFEEMGYINATQSEGKKVYAITSEGSQFLKEKSIYTEEAKEQIKDHWQSDRMGERREIMNQTRAIWQLIGQGFNDLTSEKKQQIRKILKRTYDNIHEITR